MKDKHLDEESIEVRDARKAKSEALKATIKPCVICTLPLAFVDDYTDKDNPKILATTHHYCQPMREMQRQLDRLDARVHGTEQRIIELQRIERDRSVTLRARIEQGVKNAKASIAYNLHRMAEHVEKRRHYEGHEEDE